jgi:hypothetical protein
MKKGVSKTGSGNPQNRHDSSSEPQFEQRYLASHTVPLVTGTRMNNSTYWRWATVGVLVGGIRVFLEAEKIGGRLYCSREAVQRFMALTATRRQPEPPTAPRSDAQRKKAIAKASARLDAAGV